MSRRLWIWLWLAVAASSAAAHEAEAVTEHVDAYIAAWKRFYPTEALGRGFLDSIERFEDRSAASVDAWVALNRRSLEELETLREEGVPDLDDRIDLRLLRTRVLSELDRWENDRPHERSLGEYARLLAGALDPLVDSPLLSAAAKRRLLPERLEQMAELARAARANLRDGRPRATHEALDRLRETATALPDRLAGVGGDAAVLAAAGAAEALRSLAGHVERELLPRVTLSDEPILGCDSYAEKLSLYTDSDLTPEALEKLARDEIEASRRALTEMARDYWRAVYPTEALPESSAELIARAFDDLESNRPEAEQPYLDELRRYGREVESFVRDHEIATVPEHNTLSIELAPESAGPMARIGFVRTAPPFHPNPWTTWYLATIPDSHPEQERIDFWRSFNYSFKRFIVIHELFPGHYMQLKLLRENPRRARILFPYRPFIEGWATFTERIVLDAGYAAGDRLTRLAQLRKRLENANRAYMSVQAHCNGWSEERVFEFSVKTSLLAPQFAKSLWGRLMRSPMQILTYMLMGLELRELYDEEQRRLGERFVLRDFMDTILRTGPVPTDELEAVLRAAKP